MTKTSELACIGLACIGCLRGSVRQTMDSGEINHAEGYVYLNSKSVSDTEVGTARLNGGGALKTAKGRAEVLLRPGVFLRLDEESEIKMATEDTMETRLDLVQGRALLEVVQLKTTIAISMDGEITSPLTPGLYEFEAGTGKIKIYAGRAQLHFRGASLQLRSGQAVDGTLQIRRFDTGKGDALYAWSAAASEREAEASYASARSIGSASGAWYWNPLLSCWSFVPQSGIVNGSFGWAFPAPHEIAHAMLLNGPVFHYPAAVDPHNLPRAPVQPDASGFVDIAHTPRLHGPDRPSSGDQGPGMPVSPIVIPH